MKLENKIMKRLEEEVAYRERLLGVAVDMEALAGLLIAERLDEINGVDASKEPMLKRALEAIERAGEEGITRNELTRSLAPTKSKAIKIVVDALIESGMVVQERKQKGPWRPTTIYTSARFLSADQAAK